MRSTFILATEIVLTKKQAKEGVERIRSEAKIFAEKLRSQQNTEEAYRITWNCKGTDGGHRGRLETDRTGCLDFVF